MKLTSQQESAYLKTYTNLIHRVVNKFVARSSYSSLDREDLFQECAIVLLQAIRKAESDDYLKDHFPFRDMTHAMTLYALGQQTLSYPKRTSSLKFFSQTFQEAMDIAIADAEVERPGDDYIDADTRIDLARYAATLPEDERNVLLMRCDGFRNSEIANRLGLDRSDVNRVMAKIRRNMAKSLAV